MSFVSCNSIIPFMEAPDIVSINSITAMPCGFSVTNAKYSHIKSVKSLSINYKCLVTLY